MINFIKRLFRRRRKAKIEVEVKPGEWVDISDDCKSFLLEYPEIDLDLPKDIIISGSDQEITITGPWTEP